MDGDELSREHHVRRRAEQVLNDLRELWGDELPPGPDPETTALVDTLAIDDDRGRLQGLLVQGDAVPYRLLVRLLLTSPVGRQLVAELPPALRVRVDLTTATTGDLDLVDPTPPPTGSELGPAWNGGMPQTPSGAFAMHADPPVVDIDERVSSLMGLPARQHRLLGAEMFQAVHPDDREAVAGAVTRAFERQGSVSIRYRVVHHDGSVHRLSTVGHALTGEDGRTDQIVGFTVPSP